MSSEGASNSKSLIVQRRFTVLYLSDQLTDPRVDQRLLAAAREDNEDMLLEVFEKDNFDINFQDGCVLYPPLTGIVELSRCIQAGQHR